MKIDVQGKVALVTGASRGIGLAIARALAEGGAKVGLVARKQETLDEAASSLEKDGHTVATFAAHTGREGAAAVLVAEVVKTFGKLDVLVNNAATNPHFGPMITADDKVFDKMFETNARGYFALARETAKHLIDRGAPGSIVNISSIHGLQGAPLMGVYGMSKAAIISMTQTLAVELGPSGIRVNAIAPGLIETKFAAALIGNADLLEKWNARTPLRRVGQPEEVASLALYLASDASSFVTGQTMVVDGGFCIASS